MLRSKIWGCWSLPHVYVLELLWWVNNDRTWQLVPYALLRSTCSTVSCLFYCTKTAENKPSSFMVMMESRLHVEAVGGGAGVVSCCFMSFLIWLYFNGRLMRWDILQHRKVGIRLWSDVSSSFFNIVAGSELWGAGIIYTVKDDVIVRIPAQDQTLLKREQWKRLQPAVKENAVQQAGKCVGRQKSVEIRSLCTVHLYTINELAQNTNSAIMTFFCFKFFYHGVW